MVIIFLILIFILLQANQAQFTYNPSLYLNDKYPFVLSFSDDDDYHIIASKNFYVWSWGFVGIESHTNILEYSNETIYCFDKENNIYLFYSNVLYSINYFQRYSVSEISKHSYSGKFFGSIALDNDFAIYCINSNNLVFLRKKTQNNNFDEFDFHIQNIGEELSCKYMENEIGCTNVDFSTITDYILIITLLLKKYGISKTELNRFVNEFENIIEDFRTNIPFNIYSQVIHTDTKAKLTELRKYIKK